MSHPDLRYLAHSNRLGIGAFADPVNHDLVQNPVTAAEMQGRTLTYHGGLTMPAPKVWLVFLNDFWADWHTAERTCRDIVEGGYLAPLTAYGSGSGTFMGVVQIDEPLVSDTINDGYIRAMLGNAIVNRELPPCDDNTLYVLCMPAGVKIVFDGESRGSCEIWCGYHSHGYTHEDRRFIYSVQPATNCGPCGGDFDAWTMVLAHEIAEAATDPTAQGWYDDTDGSENADIVAWVRHQYGPWVVQGFWCNETGDTVGQYIPEDQRPGHKPPEPEPPPDPRTYRQGVEDSAAVLREALARVEGLIR